MTVFSGECFIHNDKKEYLRKFDAISGEAILLGALNKAKQIKCTIRERLKKASLWGLMKTITGSLGQFHFKTLNTIDKMMKKKTKLSLIKQPLSVYVMVP